MPTFTDPIKRIERLLASSEPKMAEAFLRMVGLIKSRFTLNEIAGFLEAGTTAQALDTALRAVPIIGEAYTDSFVAAARDTARFLGRTVADIQVVFDQANANAVAAMSRNQLRLIQGFSEQQREAVRQAILDGLQRGANPREMAQAFKDAIGLTPNQLKAVYNYRRALETLSADALNRELRDRRFDSTVRRAILQNEPLTKDQIWKMLNRYTERMLAHRAETIARTEALRSVNEGVKAMYDQAVLDGTLSPEMLEQTWNTAADERVRGSHRSMNGQVQQYGQPFVSGAGNLLAYPGDPNAPASETIRCRCVVGTRITTLLPEVVG